MAIVDFDAARKRIEALNSFMQVVKDVPFVEIDDMAQAMEATYTVERQRQTDGSFLERYRRTLTAEQLAELVRVALEECK